MYNYHLFRLKQLREDHDMTQQEVADILNTTQKQYSRWERGEYEIPLHTVVRLAKLYNVSIDYIVELA